jgi:glycosyltransferase involved in cell wall biosynthesis
MDDPTETKPRSVPSRPIRLCLFSYNLGHILLGRSEGFGGAELEMHTVGQALGRNPSFVVDLVTIRGRDVAHADVRKGSYNSVRWVDAPRDLKQHDSWWRRRLVVGHYAVVLMLALLGRTADVYFSKLASLETLLAWRVARLLRRPFVFRVEHDWETDPRTVREKLLGSDAMVRRFTQMMKSADLVIVQTGVQAKAVREHYGIATRLIPNGHVIPEVPVTARETVLWVSRCHPMKRPEKFVTLARQFPQYRFVMVCPPTLGHEDLFESITAAAAEVLNLEFVPGVEYSATADYYRQARVFVLTSYAEGFSNVIIEAMKHRVPVLSLAFNPDGILADAAGHGATDQVPQEYARWLTGRVVGYAAGDRLEDLCLRLDDLMNDEQQWTARSADAFAFASSAFSVDTVARSYAEQLTRLVHRD